MVSASQRGSGVQATDHHDDHARSESRLVWSQIGCSVRRLHRAEQKKQQLQGHDSREVRTGIPSIRQTPDADHDHDDEEEEDYACLQALGLVIIFCTGFSILNTRRMSERMSTQQQRNLILTSKTIQLLLHYRPTTDGENTRYLSRKEPWFECMHEWVRAHKHDIDDMIRRSSVRTASPLSSPSPRD
jgi:hypothetical protein